MAEDFTVTKSFLDTNGKVKVVNVYSDMYGEKAHIKNLLSSGSLLTAKYFFRQLFTSWLAVPLIKPALINTFVSITARSTTSASPI